MMNPNSEDILDTAHQESTASSKKSFRDIGVQADLSDFKISSESITLHELQDAAIRMAAQIKANMESIGIKPSQADVLNSIPPHHQYRENEIESNERDRTYSAEQLFTNYYLLTREFTEGVCQKEEDLISKNRELELELLQTQSLIKAISAPPNTPTRRVPSDLSLDDLQYSPATLSRSPSPTLIFSNQFNKVVATEDSAKNRPSNNTLIEF
ncbi:MAG: hypothetical protein FJ161_01660 [Gammaproteobacteria bacterium]|nr:hypothetical protein [Gammaproteobacteria bacterium]